MNFLKNIFAKSSATQFAAARVAEKSKRNSAKRAPAFEALESRQMMSASTLAAVSSIELEPVHVRVGKFTITEYLKEPVTTVFSMNANGSVSESTAGASPTNLGGVVTQITAGLDVNGKPEVFGISPSGSVYVNDNGAGWKNLGGNAIQVSGSINGTVFAEGPNHSVSENQGKGWVSLAGQVTQISAGVDVAGKPEVFATGYPYTAAYVNDGHGWNNLGGQFKQISGTMGNTLFGISEYNTVEVNTGQSWRNLGGQATQISAGLDANGTPRVYALGSPGTEAFISIGAGWTDLNGSGVEIAAPSISVGVPGNSVAVVGGDAYTYVHNAAGWSKLPISLDALQFRYQSMGGPSGSLGLPKGSEQSVAGGKMQAYQNGTIYWSPATGAHAVMGGILAAYTGPAGSLGFPTSDPEIIPSHTGLAAGGVLNYFQNGTIFSNGNGPVVVQTASILTYEWNDIEFGNGVALGGHMALTIAQNGTYDFSWGFNDTGVAPYSFGVMVGILTPQDVLYTFAHNGSVEGDTLFTPGQSYDNGNDTGINPVLAQNWQDLQGAVAVPPSSLAGIDVIKVGTALYSDVSNAYGGVQAVIAVVGFAA